MDSVGNIYIADTENHRIRKVLVSNGIIITVAGNGTAGYNGGIPFATSTPLDFPTGVSVSTAGDMIYIVDTNNNRIRRVFIGLITTVAGDGTAGSTGDGGLAISARVNYPYGICIDSAGNLYIADSSNHRIRKLPGAFVKERVAGTGVNGYSGDGGPALQATFKASRGVAVDTLGNVIIMDNENDAIRYIVASTGIIHTICGTGVEGTATNGVVGTSSQVKQPWAVVFKDPNTAYFTDSGNNTSRVLNLTGHY